MNQLKLSARIVLAKPLRYTPAGIPAINLVLEHESERVEEGIARQIKLTAKAVAFGALAETIGEIELGTLKVFTGFLINARASKSLIFHIQFID